MTLSDLSIRRPVFAWMLMTGLIVLGSLSFMRMGISQLPDVDFPVVSVNIRLEGAAPEVIETGIVDYVEDAMMSIQGVRSVTSESENSEGTITAEFELSRDLDMAVQDVQAKVASVQPRFPTATKPPTISKANPEDQPIILLTLDSQKFPLKYLMEFVNDRLKDQFAMVSGVGDITLNGYLDPNLRIWASQKKMDKYELTVADIIAAVQNEHSESPAGQLDSGDRQLFLRTLGEATTVKEVESLNVSARGGQVNFAPLHLGQVARVEEGLADTTRMSRANGVTGVGISIRKQRGANAVAVAKGIRAKMVEIQKGLPDGMNLAVNFDSTQYIEQAVGELNFTLVLSALLTALVCWLFLGSWSSTLNVLLAIPTSTIGTFIILYFAGFTLNTFTLLGLSLSIGIVVDDAIMVLENIVRHREQGKSKVNAAIDGAREITFSALAATVSIIAIFLPVAFMSGIIGKFFFQFGVTISAAVLLSLLEALTLTPMRCSQFVSVGARRTRLGRGMEAGLDLLTRLYAKSLGWTLNWRWLVLLVSAMLFGLSFSTLTKLRKEFLPPEDQSRFNVRFFTKIGSNLAFTDKHVLDIEAFLKSRPEVDRFVLQVGGGSPGDANHGSILVTMKDKGKRGIDPTIGHELSQLEFMGVCRTAFKQVKDVRVSLQDLSTKSFVASRGYPIEFTVGGPEWDKLAQYSQQIMDELDKSGMATDLDSDYLAGMPELHVVPDRAKAMARGVNVATIDQTVNAAIGGMVIGSYPKDGHRYDIRLKLDDATGDPATLIKKLYVRNNRSERVPLSELVKVEESVSMVTINRKDRERAVSVYANVKAGVSQEVAQAKVVEIGKRVLPLGYHVALSGSSQAFNDSFNSLLFALALGLFVAYMVLASQFNSFLDPITVLMALPFSVSGAFVALLVTDHSLNIYSMIGLVLLMGIVKKNSILLVDFTNQVRTRGVTSVRAALLEACPVRLRPILMTSVATIAGAIPPAVAIGPGAESRVPMAIAIIGGVIASTFLTLYVVPVVYSLIAFNRRKRPEHGEVEGASAELVDNHDLPAPPRLGSVQP